MTSNFSPESWYEKPIMIWGMHQSDTLYLKNAIKETEQVLAYPFQLDITTFLQERPYQTYQQFIADYRLRNKIFALTSPKEESQLLEETPIPINWKWTKDLSTLPLDKVPEALWRLRDLSEVYEDISVEELQKRFDFKAFYRQFQLLEQHFSSTRDVFVAEIRSIAFANKIDDSQLSNWIFEDVGGNPDFVHTFFSHFLLGKIIYILRDPRDAYHSQMRDWKKQRKSITLKMRLRYLYVLKCHYESIFYALKTYGKNKIYICYYENLFKQQSLELKQVKNFMNSTEDTAHQTIEQLSNKTSQSTVSVNSLINNRKKDLSFMELFWVESMCINLFQSEKWPYQSNFSKLFIPLLKIIQQVIVWIVIGVKLKLQ